MTLRDDVRASLVQFFDRRLVDELLDSYEEAKRNYYLGGDRLSEVEGGRFCEAALRLLEQRTATSFTALGHPLDTERLIARLASVPSSLHPDAIRLHIPRALRLVYDVRNNRDAAHLADDIDPNVQDSTLVVSVLDWVLAEFIRLHHGVSPRDAQRIVEELVARGVPAIEDFDGFLKVLRTDLRAGDWVMLLLYERGKKGASTDELFEWVRPAMRANLRRTLAQLVDDKALAVLRSGRYEITLKGRKYVERQRLFDPAF